MGSKAALKRLEEACDKATTRQDDTRLEHGETVWFAGVPAKASKGTVALRVGGHTTVVVRSEDAAGAVLEDDLYFLEVPLHTSVLLRHESVVDLAPDRGACSCKGNDADGTAHLDDPVFPGLEGLLPPFDLGVFDPGSCFHICEHTFKCTSRKLRDGTIIRICIPALKCDLKCPVPVPR